MKKKEIVINVFDFCRAKEAFGLVFFFCTLPICTFGIILCTAFSTIPMLLDTMSVFVLLSLILFICCYFIMYCAEKIYRKGKISNGKTL
jgi:hypothetical protein